MLSQCASSITLLLTLELMCALQRINFALIKNWQNFKLPAGVEHFFVTAIISKTTQMSCLFAIQTPLPHEKKKGWVHAERSPQDSKSALPRIPVDERLSSSSFRHRRFSHFPFLVSRSARRRGGDCGSCLLTCFLSFLPRSPNACMHHRNPHAQICSSCIFSSSCHSFVCCWRQVTDFQEDEQ